MLLDTLGASFLGNMLAGKGFVRQSMVLKDMVLSNLKKEKDFYLRIFVLPPSFNKLSNTKVLLE